MTKILHMADLAERVHADAKPASLEVGQQAGKMADAPSFFPDVVYPLMVRTVTGMLIVVLCLWMLAGVINTLWEVRNAIGAGWAGTTERVIVNALIMLALLEVIRTLQAYLKLGRVRVTFILDTALVVLIGELMGLWFKEYDVEKVMLGLGTIITLVILRIATAKSSPESPGVI